MPKPKVQAYLVSIDIPKLALHVRVSGESFEDALAQARNLTVPDILKDVEDYIDWNSPVVTGIFTA